MNMLREWSEAVIRELGIADVVTPAAAQPLALELAKDVAHRVACTAAPLTAHLPGVAVGRSAAPAQVAPELAEALRRLAERWSAEHPDRGGPAVGRHRTGACVPAGVAPTTARRPH